MELVLISCSSKKLDRMAAARDLYISPLFRASVKWAEAWGYEWAVMSAKYGLVKPHTHIHPYDTTIHTITQGKVVANLVLTALEEDEEYISVTDLIVLAGRKYVDPLIEMNGCGDEEPFDIIQPLQGMQIGQRLSWLKGPGLECWDTYQG